MAYVTPTSNIILLKGVGLPSDGSHQYRFHTRQEQEAFFKGFATPTTTFTYQTYTRINENTVKIQHNAKGLYNCDYLMIQNNDNDTDVQRWYYAYITDVEYVNERTSVIHYKIDVFQTWWLIARPEYAFVERMHTASDNMYENTLPENFELGPYWLSNFQDTKLFGTPSVTVDQEGAFNNWKPVLMFPLSKTQNPQYVGGTVSMVSYRIFDSMQDMYDFLENVSQERMAELIYAFMFPEAFINKTNPNIYSVKSLYVNRQRLSKSYTPSQWGSWVPKNNKMFTYPYCFFYITNYQGNSAVYRFENFRDKTGDIRFRIDGCLSPNASFMLTPEKYGSEGAFNYNEPIYLSGLPSIPITVDTYRVWLAQNKNSLAVENLSTAISAANSVIGGVYGGASSVASSSGNPASIAGAVAGAVPGIVGGVTDAYLNVSRLLAKREDSKTMPDQVKGTPDATIQYSQGVYDFGIGYQVVKSEYAKRIDNFWTMYGYPVGRLRTINLFTRPKFTFIKASNLTFAGNPPSQEGAVGHIPATARTELEALFNAGITFWEPGATIGDYSVDNSP